MKFLNDVYCFTEYIYSKSQYPACPPLFVITFRSRWGMKCDKSCSVESGLFEPSFQILHGFRSWVFIDNFIHYAPKILHRVNIWGIWGPACFLYKIWQGFFAPCLGGLGCVCWRPVLDERHVAIGAEQFSLVCCFIHIFTVKDRLHFFL